MAKTLIILTCQLVLQSHWNKPDWCKCRFENIYRNCSHRESFVELTNECLKSLFQMNNLKKQVENKTKCIEELQQENKVLQKKLTAESKKSNTYEGKVGLNNIM